MSQTYSERPTYLVPVNSETIEALAAGATPAELATGAEPDLETLHLAAPPVWSGDDPDSDPQAHILYSDEAGVWAWWGVNKAHMAALMAVYTAGLTPGRPSVEIDEVFPLSRPPDEQALLDRIAQAPEDDALRLEYADYLDSIHDARGEVVRLQVEMTQLSSDEEEERFPALWDRAEKLLEAEGREWYRPLAALHLWPTLGTEFCPEFFMSRGLLESIWVHVPDVLPRYAEQLWSFAPTLNSLAFFDTLDVPGFARLPQLKRLRELSILCNEPDQAEADMAALADCPYLEKLESLTLGYSINEAAAQRLFAAGWLDQLRELDLQRADLSAASIEALTSRGGLYVLKSLDLGGSGFTEKAATNLSENPAFRDLVSLRITDAPLAGATIRELALGAWPHLERLDLGGGELREDDVEFLAEAPSLPALETLNLRGSAIGSRGAAALATSPYLQRIQSLDVDRSALDEDDQQQLALRFGDALNLHD